MGTDELMHLVAKLDFFLGVVQIHREVPGGLQRPGRIDEWPVEYRVSTKAPQDKGSLPSRQSWWPQTLAAHYNEPINQARVRLRDLGRSRASEETRHEHARRESPEATERFAQSRAAVDAVYGQPPVQGGAAPAGGCQGHALFDAGRPQSARRHRRSVGGHCRQKIVDAIKKQAETIDYATGFQLHHPAAFQAAEKLVSITPKGLDHVFFANSGSEAVDTALKIALAYHRVRGEGTRRVLIGRERGYHGVGFGGISVGGMSGNRKTFGNMLASVDHLRHTHDPARNAFSRGQPEHGAEFADELERLVQLHDASNIAGVIVEPVAGSTGVLVPPKGYLQKLRQICDKHGILLIFDEVITGFGRTGKAFAAQTFGVTPDMITCAKALTNAAVPMGGVIVKKGIYDAFMQGPENAIELFHG